MPHFKSKGKGDADVDVQGDVPDIDINVKKPKVDVDVSGEGPELDVDGGHKKDWGINLPKFGFKKGDKHADVDADVNVKPPDASIDIKGPKVHIGADSPDADVEGGADISAGVDSDVKVDGDKKGFKFGFHMPKFKSKSKGGADIDVEADAPDIDVNLKKPKLDVDVSGEGPELEVDGGHKKDWGINLPKFGVKGGKDIDVDAEIKVKPKGEMYVDTPDVVREGKDVEINVNTDSPKTKKGWGFHMPQFHVKSKEKQYDVDSPEGKAKISVDAPQLPQGDVELEGPEVDVRGPELDVNGGDGKKKEWGINFPKFGFKKSPKEADADVNVSVKPPDGSLDIKGPQVHAGADAPDLDIEGGGDVSADLGTDMKGGGDKKGFKFGFHMPKFNSKGKGNADIAVGGDAPDIDVNLKKPKVDVDVSGEGPELDVDGGHKKDWGIHLPKFGLNKGDKHAELDADLNVNPPDANVDIKGPKVHAGAGAPDVDISGGGDIQIPAGVDTDINVDGDKKGSKFGFHMPHFKSKGKANADVGVEGDIPNVDLDINKPKVDVSGDVGVDVEKPHLSADIDQPSPSKREWGFHLPKFHVKGGDKVDDDGKASTPSPDTGSPETKEKFKINIFKKKPKVSANVDVPEGGVDVNLPSGDMNADVDLGGPSVTSTPKKGKFHMHLPKGQDEVENVDLFVKEEDSNILPRFKTRGAASVDIDAPDVHIDVPKVDVKGDVDIPKVVAGGKIDIEGPKVEGSLPDTKDASIKGGGGAKFGFKLPTFKKKERASDSPAKESSSDDEVIDHTKDSHKFKINLFGKKAKAHSLEGDIHAPKADVDISAKAESPDVSISSPHSGANTDVKVFDKSPRFKLFSKGKVKSKAGAAADGTTEKEVNEVTVKEEEFKTLPRIHKKEKEVEKPRKSFTLPSFFRRKGKSASLDLEAGASVPSGEYDVDVGLKEPFISVNAPQPLDVQFNGEGGPGAHASASIPPVKGDGGVSADLNAPKAEKDSNHSSDKGSDKHRKFEINWPWKHGKTPKDLGCQEVSAGVAADADLGLKRTDSPVDVPDNKVHHKQDERVQGETEVIKEPFHVHLKGPKMVVHGAPVSLPSVGVVGEAGLSVHAEHIPEVDELETINPREYRYPFRHLVLQGKGLTCTAHVGVIKSLESNLVLREIKHFVGTGVGGLVAALLAAGSDSAILSRYLKQEIPKLLSARPKCLPSTLARKYGHTPEERVTNWLGAKLKGLLGDSNVTLSKVRDLTKNTLHLIVTNASQMCSESLGPDNHPDLPVKTAVRMCLAHRGLLKPFPYSLHEHEEVFYTGSLLRPYPVDEYDKMYPEGAPEETHTIINPHTLGVVLHSTAEVKAYTQIAASREEGDERAVDVEKKDDDQFEVNLDEASLEAAEVAAPMMRFLQTVQKHQTDPASKVISKEHLETVLQQRTDLPHDDIKLLFGEKRTATDVMKVIGTKNRNQITYHELLSYFDKKIKQHDRTSETFDTAGNPKTHRFEALYIGVQEILSSTSTGPLYNLSKENMTRTIMINTGDLADTEMSLEEPEKAYLEEEGCRATEDFLRRFVLNQGLIPLDQDDLDEDDPELRLVLTRRDISELIDEELSEIIDERDYDENCKFVGSYKE